MAAKGGGAEQLLRQVFDLLKSESDQIVPLLSSKTASFDDFRSALVRETIILDRYALLIDVSRFVLTVGWCCESLGSFTVSRGGAQEDRPDLESTDESEERRKATQRGSLQVKKEFHFVFNLIALISIKSSRTHFRLKSEVSQLEDSNSSLKRSAADESSSRDANERRLRRERDELERTNKYVALKSLLIVDLPVSWSCCIGF